MVEVVSNNGLEKSCPKVDAIVDGLLIADVIVDAGAAVNVMNANLCERLNLDLVDGGNLTLKLADNSRLKAEGILSGLSVSVAGKVAKVDFYVVRMQAGREAYAMLLGRPWLRKTDCLVDISSGHLIFGRGKKRVIVNAYPNLPESERVEIPDTYWEGEDSVSSDSEESNSKEAALLLIEQHEGCEPLVCVRDADADKIMCDAHNEDKVLLVGAYLDKEPKKLISNFLVGAKGVFAWNYDEQFIESR
ncbi:hypothetical protein O6H91_12G076100 [Diphasiastrum complanatum]|uniref:Uncharacterized protein n=1 Tax=Diphasiastrum complanatum TaxID=34168 RepID=A0ACC2C3R5_DIPCM|nr:hypothetical protein O6H91_12G076100 [Diphasiastrum complanatum]